MSTGVIVYECLQVAVRLVDLGAAPFPVVQSLLRNVSVRLAAACDGSNNHPIFRSSSSSAPRVESTSRQTTYKSPRGVSFHNLTGQQVPSVKGANAQQAAANGGIGHEGALRTKQPHDGSAAGSEELVSKQQTDAVSGYGKSSSSKQHTSLLSAYQGFTVKDKKLCLVMRKYHCSVATLLADEAKGRCWCDQQKSRRCNVDDVMLHGI